MDLGYVNVDAMLRGFTAKQFFEWVAYARLEPFGESREDVRNARILQMLFNVNVEKKHQKLSLKDFILKFVEEEEEAPKQGPKDHARIIRALFAAYSIPGDEDSYSMVTADGTQGMQRGVRP